MEKLLNNLNGKLLAFGIKEEKYLKIIDSNKKIKECSLLNSIDLEKNKKGFGRNKRISPKKLKKIYGYKTIDSIIINEQEIKSLEKKLISKFIYIGKNDIYIYNIDDIEKVIKRYKRYSVKIEKLKSNENILKINIKNAKPKRIIEPFYYIYDCLNDFFDLISELLVS